MKKSGLDSISSRGSFYTEKWGVFPSDNILLLENVPFICGLPIQESKTQGYLEGSGKVVVVEESVTEQDGYAFGWHFLSRFQGAFQRHTSLSPRPLV